jgi:hypothetical protein
MLSTHRGNGTGKEVAVTWIAAFTADEAREFSTGGIRAEFTQRHRV